MTEFWETPEPASNISINENDRHAFREVATYLTVWGTSWGSFSLWLSTNAIRKIVLRVSSLSDTLSISANRAYAKNYNTSFTSHDTGLLVKVGRSLLKLHNSSFKILSSGGISKSYRHFQKNNIADRWLLIEPINNLRSWKSLS